MDKRPYESYAAYLAHQRKKTASPALREKLGKYRAGRVRKFLRWFVDLQPFLAPGARGICLGARFGEEVEALQQMGFDAIGIDLVPHPPFVIEADFHAIPFDQEFDFVYSNSVDHVFDLVKFCTEIQRVLRPQAAIMFTLALRQWGRHESLRIDDLAEITEHFPDFTAVHTNDKSEDWARSGGLNFAVILQRKAQAE